LPGDWIRLEAGLESRLSCRLVLFASVYALARLLVAILLHAQAEAERDLELLAMGHEVAALRRQVKRPVLPAGRLVLAPLGRRLPVGRLLFTPATILRWRRGAAQEALFQRVEVPPASSQCGAVVMPEVRRR